MEKTAIPLLVPAALMVQPLWTATLEVGTTAPQFEVAPTTGTVRLAERTANPVQTTCSARTSFDADIIDERAPAASSTRDRKELPMILQVFRPDHLGCPCSFFQQGLFFEQFILRIGMGRGHRQTQRFTILEVDG